MSAHARTPDEDARIAPTLTRRVSPWTIAHIAAWLGLPRARVRRRRRALRRLLHKGGR